MLEDFIHSMMIEYIEGLDLQLCCMLQCDISTVKYNLYRAFHNVLRDYKHL